MKKCLYSKRMQSLTIQVAPLMAIPAAETGEVYWRIFFHLNLRLGSATGAARAKVARRRREICILLSLTNNDCRPFYTATKLLYSRDLRRGWLP